MYEPSHTAAQHEDPARRHSAASIIFTMYQAHHTRPPKPPEAAVRVFSFPLNATFWVRDKGNRREGPNKKKEI